MRAESAFFATLIVLVTVSHGVRADEKSVAEAVGLLYQNGVMSEIERRHPVSKSELPSLATLSPNFYGPVSLYDETGSPVVQNWPFRFDDSQRFYGDVRWMGNSQRPHFRVFYSNGEKHNAWQYDSIVILQSEEYNYFLTFCTSMWMRNALFFSGSVERAVDFGYPTIGDYEDNKFVFQEIDHIFIYHALSFKRDVLYDLWCKEASSIAEVWWRHEH
jgi:hypothetical protein